MSSAHQLKNYDNAAGAEAETTKLSTTTTSKASESEESANINHNISALAVQLQALQTENSQKNSEIAHLKRQLTLLSEFKGFDIKGKGLWESKGFNERSFMTVLSGLEGAMNHTQRNYDDGGENIDYDGNDLSESASSLNDKLLQSAAATPNKYEDYDEIAFLSPKVSELLKEEALALDDVLDTSAWSDSSDSSDDGHGKNKRRRKKRNDDDEDGMNEELAGLEAAGLSLQEELALAADGFADLYGGDNHDDSYANEESGANLGGTNNNEGWEDSIHEYYKSNNQHNTQTSSTNDTNNDTTPQQLLSKLKLSYSLADHAITLDVTRKVSDRGLYTRPLLSRNEIETLGVLTLPNWIARPGGEEDSSIDNTSRGREMYMNRILSCTTEYVEPPKSKILRKLFSGWVPGPGERRPEDERGGGGSRMDGDEDSKLVTAYSTSKSPHESADNEDDDNDDFEEIRSRSHQQLLMEPLPVRTVTMRIRPDVLCGAVMTALTAAVEKVGGTLTKRQGGHLRAIIPGRKVRVWMPGEWEREQSKVEEGDEERETEEQVRNTSFGSHDDSDSQSVVSMLSAMSFTSPLKSPKLQRPTFKMLPPYLIDAQLVTKKLGKECERVLLVRVYRIQDIAQQRSGADDQEEFLDVPAPLDLSANVDLKSDGRRIDLELESKRSVSALQDAASLVQMLKAVGGEGFAIDQPQPMLTPLDEQDNGSVTSHTSTKSYLKSFGDAITSPIRYFSGSSVAPLLTSPTPSGPKTNTVIGLMSMELRRKCQASPSVGTYSKSDKSHGLYPCLAKEDAPYVQSSWIFLKVCIEELDQRCLGYSTLGVSPLFKSPSLTQIDVHYIAQIKAFCRESMIVSLVKTASELEVYAREQEVSCSNLDHLLRPTFDAYKLAPPPLPKPVPLTAYPLDFQPPEGLAPPWGPEVMKVLEKISAESTNDGTVSNRTRLSSFDRAKRAVSLVVAAFQRQHDVEQGARLGRKNMQCMDRLAKMQAHKRNSILKIRDSYGSNLLSTNAADDYHLLRQKSSNAGSLSDTIHAIPDQVPLLICNVLVGNAAGTCFITSSHVLFHTQLVPIIGGEKVHLFSIKDVELTINPPSKSMLSPLPASISLTTSISRNKATREEVYHFIPSIGARRFAKFFEVVRDVLVENPDTLKLTERGGLVYMYDDSK